MDQSELNVTMQKWLESLLHPAENQQNPTSLAVQPGSQDLNEVLGKLRHLLRLNESPKTSLRAGGTHLVVLARSIAAYLQAALDVGDLDRASRTLSQQTTKALMTIFRLTGKKLTPFYHDDRKDGIARVAQMALYAKYQDYATKGAAIFHEKPPVFYISDTGYTADCHNLSGMLGVPMSSCRLVASTTGGSFNSMDMSALETAIEKDLEKGMVPIMIIAYAGTPLAGHVEDMGSIRRLCTQHKIWMHVQGHALSSLCLPTTDKEVALCREADSMTLYPGTWFGLLSSPCLEDCTEFPPGDLTLVEGSIPIPRINWNGMMPGGLLRLLPLSLWLSVQYLGTSTLVETVSYCQNLTQHMIAKLDEVPGIKRFNVPTHQSFTVLFKYFGGGEVEYTSRLNTSEEEPDVMSSSTTDTESQSGTASKVVVQELALPTCNIANAMIARDLQSYFPKVGISPLKLPEQGVSFRFDPINSFPEHSTSLEDVDKFVEALKQRTQSIHVTALARRLIETELKGQPNLRCLEFPSFFGSGFIQYVPTDWADKTELSLEEVSELNQLNIELSSTLAEKNPSFSSFQHGNFSCIMIKELQPDVNLQEFLDGLILETSTFEENKKFIDGMTEKIKKGIEVAETDLIKDKTLKEQEEGYLRYVPIVGSVLNWFAPSTPTTPHGRTFDLSSGKVEGTETTYKYKMQLKDCVKEAEVESVNVSISDLPATEKAIAMQEEAAIAGGTAKEETTKEEVATGLVPTEGVGEEAEGGIEVGSEVKEQSQEVQSNSQ